MWAMIRRCVRRRPGRDQGAGRQDPGHDAQLQGAVLGSPAGEAQCPASEEIRFAQAIEEELEVGVVRTPAASA